MANSLIPTMADKQYIEQMAHGLSQYDGDNYEGDNYEDNYDAPKRALTTGVFTVRITNTDTAKKDFYLFSGYLIDSIGFGAQFTGAFSAAGVPVPGYGQMVDGPFKSVGSTSFDLRADADTENGTNDWLAYLKNIRGNKVTKVVVRSANPSVHSQRITITKKDPLNQLSDRTIRLSTWRNPMQQDQNTTIINEGFGLGLQDFVKFSIPGSTTDMVIELHMNGYAS